MIVHNGTIRADGSPQELLELTNKDTLEEAYVSLTSDKARLRTEDDTKESKLAKWWRIFLTGKHPKPRRWVKMSNSWRFISTIAKKEIVEFVRDWRTLLALVIIPLLIFPALFIALPLLLESEAAELDALELEIVWQGDYNSDLEKSFNNSNVKFTFEPMPTNVSNLSDIGDDLNRIRTLETQAIFRLPPTILNGDLQSCIYRLVKRPMRRGLV